LVTGRMRGNPVCHQVTVSAVMRKRQQVNVWLCCLHPQRFSSLYGMRSTRLRNDQLGGDCHTHN
jgi:hypothetical protein